MITVRIKEKHGVMLLQSIVKEVTTVYTRAGNKRIKAVKRLFSGKILHAKLFLPEELPKALEYLESI